MPTGAPPTDADVSTETHSAFCFHEKFRAQVLPEELQQARERFHSSLDPRQRELGMHYEALSSIAWTDEQDRFVELVCRHFPGLAPAIRAVAYHIQDDGGLLTYDCCQEPKKRSEGPRIA